MKRSFKISWKFDTILDIILIFLDAFIGAILILSFFSIPLTIENYFLLSFYILILLVFAYIFGISSTEKRLERRAKKKGGNK